MLGSINKNLSCLVDFGCPGALTKKNCHALQNLAVKGGLGF